MAIERALVLEVKGEQALVMTQRRSACESCKLENSCGQGLISKLGSDRSMEFWIENTLNAQPQQTITLSVPDEGLLHASIMMFVIPLLCMLVLAGIGMGISGGEGDAASIVGGSVGLLIGFYIARVRSVRLHADQRFTPVMQSLALTSTDGGACHSAP